MKITLIIFISILTYGCQKANINDASKRNEDWIFWIDEKTGEASWVPVTKEESTVKNGKYISFYTKGSIYEKGRLKNGKYIDTIYCYDLNENLIKYKLVKPDTIIDYYIKDGPYKEYFQNGGIYEQGIIRNHEHWGDRTRFHENGKIQFIDKVKDSTGLKLWYHDNGQISESVYYLNGKVNGVVKIWFKNGQIDEICHWKHGIQEGICENYYENGKPKQKVNWINDKEDGKSEMWYENGQKRQVGYYKNGVLDGQILQWYANGRKKAASNFISGKPAGETINYYENGKVKATGSFKDGKRNGIFLIYDENGKIVEKDIYKNGELETP